MPRRNTTTRKPQTRKDAPVVNDLGAAYAAMIQLGAKQAKR